jgi:hypothetical protein
MQGTEIQIATHGPWDSQRDDPHASLSGVLNSLIFNNPNMQFLPGRHVAAAAAK